MSYLAKSLLLALLLHATRQQHLSMLERCFITRRGEVDAHVAVGQCIGIEREKLEWNAELVRALPSVTRSPVTR